jgi:hypothetical protein
MLSDDATDSFHIQILMKVVISNVARSIHDTTDYSILESLYDISVAGTTPKLNTISPYWLENLLVHPEWRAVSLQECHDIAVIDTRTVSQHRKHKKANIDALKVGTSVSIKIFPICRYILYNTNKRTAHKLLITNEGNNEFGFLWSILGTCLFHYWNCVN